MPAGVWGLEEDNGMKEGEEGWRRWSVWSMEMGAGRKGKVQQVFYW